MASVPNENSLEPILDILKSSNRDAILYLEKKFGLQNPCTIRAIGVAMWNTENVHECVRFFVFFLNVLKPTANVIFFRMIPCINAMCTWIILLLKDSDSTETVEVALEIFRNYAKHIEEFGTRFQRLSDKEKSSKLILVDSHFYSIIRLMQTVYDLSPGNLCLLNGCVEDILSNDLRGTGHDSLMHFCVKRDFPVDICRALLACKADVNSQNFERFTPVHYTIYSPQYQQKETIEMFLTYGFVFKTWNDGRFCLPCTLNQLDILPRPVKNTTLQCLAARVIIEIDFRIENEVPRHLQNLVYSHY